jgi:hypothetical protein
VRTSNTSIDVIIIIIEMVSENCSKQDCGSVCQKTSLRLKTLVQLEMWKEDCF